MRLLTGDQPSMLSSCSAKKLLDWSSVRRTIWAVVPDECCASTVDMLGFGAATFAPTMRTPAFSSCARSMARLPRVGWATYHGVVCKTSPCTANGDSGPTSHGTYDVFQ